MKIHILICCYLPSVYLQYNLLWWKKKTIWNRGYGSYLHPLLVFFKKLYRTKLNTQQIAMQVKQVIQKILKKSSRRKSINKHTLSKNITKHCKIGPPTALHSPIFRHSHRHGKTSKNEQLIIWTNQITHQNGNILST